MRFRSAAGATLAGTLALAAGGCGGGGGNAGRTTASSPAASAPAQSAAVSSATSPSPAGAAQPSHEALRVVVRGPGHEPVAGRLFPITVRVTRGGRPVSGTLSYGFLVAGQLVARRSRYRFRDGRFRDELRFPARAVGLPLTLRVLVRARDGARGHGDLAVRVKPR